MKSKFFSERFILTFSASTASRIGWTEVDLLSVYHMTRWIGNKEVKLMLEIWLKEIYGMWYVCGSVTRHAVK